MKTVGRLWDVMPGAVVNTDFQYDNLENGLGYISGRACERVSTLD